MLVMPGLGLNLKIEVGGVGLGQGSHVDNTSQNYRFMRSPVYNFYTATSIILKKVESEKEYVKF